jgi:hypothetical protein
LIISVPKRVLRSAVRRNTVKRVVRESWRQAPVIGLARFSPPAVLVRLVRVPSVSGGAAPGVAMATPAAESPSGQSGSLATAADEASVKAAAEAGARAAAEAGARAGAKAGANNRSAASGRIGLRRFKQVLRADLDAIWTNGDPPSQVRRRAAPGRDR